MIPPIRALSLAALLVLAGCSVPDLPTGSDGDDRLGVEGGYAATDPLPVRTDDGLNESEREAVLARTMARVEAIRGLEFTRDVEVRVVSRAEYRADRANETAADGGFREQVWEAPFLVGERTTVGRELDAVYGTAVGGYYAGDEIVIVSDTETPTLDTRTLAHELVHALQAQHLGFGSDRRTLDGRFARDGLIEGDANAVEIAYEARCGDEWECLPRSDRANLDEPAFDSDVYLVLIQPYAEGPAFVNALRERGGWVAVNDAYDRMPTTTEQVIHPERYPEESPVEVRVEDRSSDGWARFEREGPESTTLGEATVYAMFRANGVVEGGERFDYSHPLSDGWAGDRLVPYHDGDEAGYVWRTEWDTERDAREFVRGYRDLLAARGATRDGNVYVVPEGDPYADAFRVTREGTTVTVVNAPTRGELDAVHRTE
ncbi:Hvo_1808 family surface protein [Halomarina halobia]|uniref:Hvo_1808 family surface protein n=1 Tax=Halomarina halobia TaxID=3033386 RepID=A0ABD6AAH4_9EURY|nr:Hvo_1808 family surface protein [Halomarina sp. PSR21]